MNRKSSNIINLKSISFLFVIMAILLIFGLTTGAWFASEVTQNVSLDAPNCSVAIYNGNDLISGNSFTFDKAKQISIKNNGNIDCYVRAKIIINCVDAQNNILADKNASDYISITINSDFVEPTQISDNSHTYQAGFIYYYDSTQNAFKFLEPIGQNGQNEQNSSVILVSGASDYTTNNQLQQLPQGVSLRVTIFAEAIQKDISSLGLSRWRV